MPHDKSGQLIDVGYIVRVKTYEQGAYVEKNGVVTSVTPGATACNIEVTVVQRVNVCATASEVELIAKG